jgi:glycosyltransferase involved in cell wall biosynthesis
MTDASDLGPLTVSMLKGEKGNQAKEIVKLIKYIEQGDKPDIICLSNILLIGLAESLIHHFKLPIVCYLQGEDFFIEGLADSFTRKSWELIKKQSQFVDSFVAVSDYYGGVIHDRSEIELEKIEVIHNGIDLDGYDQMPEKNYEADIHIGYLSRICPGKGLNMLIDAFIDLKRKPQFSHVKLDVCGTITEADRVYLDEIISRLEKFNLMQDVRIIENVTREEKLKFLEDIHLLCVPALYGEAFGLYVIEAMAASVAVLQPETASFPELISATQGGELYQAHIPMSLIDSLSELLLDTEKLRTMGVRAKKSVFEKFSITHCSEKHKKLFERLLT